MSTWDERAQLAAEYLTAQKRMPKATAEYVEPVLVDMARWQREALLSDESVERAARAVLAHDPDRMECHDHPEAGCCPAGCHDFTETDHEHQARAMLTAAIEGEK